MPPWLLPLYTKDDGRISTGRMAMAPCLDVLPLHCHYNRVDYLAILNKIREHFYGSYSVWLFEGDLSVNCYYTLNN